MNRRLYEDYIKKSRLLSYEEVLLLAKSEGYIMMGIHEFMRYVEENGNIDDGKKILVNRHDIDTSPRVARKMFNIEKKVYGKEGNSTFYFRDSTTDVELINDIESYGYETGYHYEELATFEKKKKYKDVNLIRQHLPEIRKQFEKDFIKYKKITGTNSYSVASHGDFVNTLLGIQSVEILQDVSLRNKLDIKVEAYDESIMKYVSIRLADQVLLENFSSNVKKAITDGMHIIMILTHPRNWEVDFIANNRENIKRLYQGIKYKL
ncbi:MAG: hypothetical protein ACLRPW_13450 [Intestinibacter sp.]